MRNHKRALETGKVIGCNKIGVIDTLSAVGAAGTFKTIKHSNLAVELALIGGSIEVVVLDTRVAVS